MCVTGFLAPFGARKPKMPVSPVQTAYPGLLPRAQCETNGETTAEALHSERENCQHHDQRDQLLSLRLGFDFSFGGPRARRPFAL